MKFLDKLQHAWNAFKENNSKYTYESRGTGYAHRPDRVYLTGGNARSIVGPIYNRLAIDVASLKLRHIKQNEDEIYMETLNTSLNNCLSIESNIDQTGSALIQDAVLSLFDEGCIAIVPTETSLDPKISDSYNILSLRVGQILEWYPSQVRLRVYNESTGQKEDIFMLKKDVCIIENPLYIIMNEPNGTLKRLVEKLNLLDAIDKQSSSGKLDLLIQLPYVLKTAARKEAADIRRQEIETQLEGSKYGIAYIDGTEKVTQLNRPAENNLMTQIEYLTNMLHDQLGLTEAVFNGTADEKTMLNYYNRTIIPIIKAVVDEMNRKFLTKTARTQGQIIRAFKNPFDLVPISELADIADKFTRNEIFTSNDVRSIVGWRPSKQPVADELRNKNLNKPDPQESQIKKEEKK